MYIWLNLTILPNSGSTADELINSCGVFGEKIDENIEILNNSFNSISVVYVYTITYPKSYKL